RRRRLGRLSSRVFRRDGACRARRIVRPARPRRGCGVHHDVARSQGRARTRTGLTRRTMSDTVVTIEIIDPAHHHAQSCLAAYYEELNRRFDAGFDPERSRTVGLDEVTPPNGVF